MSVNTTMDITRRDAIREIQMRLFSLSDDEIATLLYEIIGHKIYHNFRIVHNYDPAAYCSYDQDKYFCLLEEI